MSHHHDHEGQAHAHAHAAGGADRRWLGAALALILAFMAAEVAVGVVAHSLALFSDAAHMLTDAAALALALLAMRLAARPARGSFTYGWTRTEILSAQANGLTLLLLSVWLTYEAVRRLITPPVVDGPWVVATAVAGIAVNIAASWCVSRADRGSLNVEGAFQHILTDLYGFIATAVAGIVVWAAHLGRADAVASLVVVALMVRAGLGLVKASGRIFLEAAPAGSDPDAVGDVLAAQQGVAEIHDLHLWEITSGQAALSAHVLVAPGLDCHRVRRELERLLRTTYRITHTTLQVDHLGEEDGASLLQITSREAVEREPPHRGEDTHGPVHRAGPHPH